MTIHKLIDGFKSFRQEYYIDQPDIYKDLVEKGQHPEVIVIACSDSRVNPSIITQANPGEIFVVRNVANLVPIYRTDHNCATSACIEFAVRDLGVKHIVVLGHSECGGIKRLCEYKEIGPERDFIDGWVSIAETAGATDLEGFEKFRHVERAAITVSLENLLNNEYISNAWVYRFISNNWDPRDSDHYVNSDSEIGYNMAGYFPEAKRNYLLSLTLGF